MAVAITDRRAHLTDPDLYRRYYEALGHGSVYAPMEDYEPRLQWVLKWLGREDDAIDIGCDKGHMTFALRKRTRGCVVGLDIAQSSIRANEANPAFVGYDMEWVSATAEQTPFPDSSFDVAYLCEILEHVVDPAVCIAEAERIVRPGGKVVISVPVDAEALEQQGSGHLDNERAGFDLEGHVREYHPEVELLGKKDLLTVVAKLQFPFAWRMSVHTVDK